MNERTKSIIDTGRQGGFSNCPPWWFKSLAWTFPFWTTTLVVLFLIALSFCFNMLGYSVTAAIPHAALPQMFIVIPLVIFTHAFVTNNWFRKNIVAIMCVNIFWILTSGTTQGSLAMTAWHASGMPIQGTLKEAESCSDGMFLPNRCGSELNSRASATLRRMYEKQLCNQTNPGFVCRLLILDLNSAPICYRIENSRIGGELYYSRLDHEPFAAYPQKQSHSTEAKSFNKIMLVTPKQMIELSKNFTAAKGFYNQNKFRTVEYDETQKQNLLEFQVTGKYYFYCFHDNNRWGDDPKAKKLEPEFIVTIKDICEDVVRSN